MSILEEFLEKISSLPIDFNRNLRLIQDLDTKAQNKSTQLETMQNNYLNNIKSAKDKKGEPKKQDNKSLLDSIKEYQEELIALQKEKVLIADQLEEMVVEYLQKLDEDIKASEEELKKNNEEIEIKDELKTEMLSPYSKKKKKDYPNKLKRTSKTAYSTKGIEPPAQTEIIDNSIKTDDQLEGVPDTQDKKYCYSDCKKARGSFGDMVACDNPLCINEWFHLECISMTTFPKGKWYCKDCQKIVHPQKKKNDSNKQMK